MLNSALRSQIVHPELRLFYDSNIRPSFPSIRAELSKAVKEIRKKHNKSGVDLLIDKQTKFCEFDKKRHKYLSTGGWYKAKIVDLSKRIFETTKHPPKIDLGSWRSIEFEMIFKDVASIDEFVYLVRRAGYMELVTIKTDGSIELNPGDKKGAQREIVVTYKYGQEQVVRDVCGFLRGIAYVNRSCGTHVHFDMRQFDETTAMNIGTRLSRCVPALRLMMPKYCRTHQYCREQMSAINAGTRSAFINMTAYTKYKTIEVRGHSGTINADKILNWIELCATIMNTSIASHPTADVKSVKEMIERYGIEGNLVQYINDRYKQFNEGYIEDKTEGEETIQA